jgi:guanylate cyclase soluble subunit alpha
LSLGSLQGFLTAQALFSGQPIEAKTHDDVTMLFSDIVGFTSICSTATPMMVINMLQDLYNKFDAFCGQLDVYKVRLTPKHLLFHVSE